MTILLWAMFGMINGLLINAFGGEKKATSLGAALIGGVGAISGGTFAYLLFGQSSSVNIFSLSLLLLEGIVLAFVLSGRAFKSAL